MQRSSTSHKSDNGTVAVIGGSLSIHGAPLFSALAAEASGVDLVYVCVPRPHAAVARMQSLNFQVHSFQGSELEQADLEPILKLLATMDAAVIGPGLAWDDAHLAVLRTLIMSGSCSMVIDASALQPWTLDAASGKRAVLTPHLGELERMCVKPESIGDAAQSAGVVIHLKGAVDRIAAPDRPITDVTGGNAGLTVGGTGDALAGLIAGLIAQGMEPPDACALASTVIKRAGTFLFPEYGYAYGTRRVIEQIPHILRTLE